MSQAVIAIGGNHESTQAAIGRALRTLGDRADTEVTATSSLYRSEPMGARAGEPFLNGVCVIETELPPIGLLDVLQQIEAEQGRVRDIHWGPRTLDLDIVFYDDEVIASDRLTIPHPHCWYRRFVLAPLAEIRPNWRHPQLNVTVEQLFLRLTVDPLSVAYAGNVDSFRLNEIQAAFPDVRFDRQSAPLAPPASGIGLAFDMPLPLPSFWLRVESAANEEFVTDVLTAARGLSTMAAEND